MKSRIFTIRILIVLGCLSILTFYSGIIPDAVAENVVIICNKNVSESSLSKTDVKQIFLGQKSQWSDGSSISIMTLKKGDTHKQFCKTFTRKSTSQFRAYWKKMVFTGKGQNPPTVATEKELIEFVIKTEGAVGYLSTQNVSDLVKTLSVN